MALASYSFIGIKNLLFKDKSTGEVACNVRHLVDLNLTDQMNEDFLRGGYGFNKLMTVYSGRETKLEGSTATQTTALTKIMSNSETVNQTIANQQIEEFVLTGSKATLTLSPTVGEAITVCSLDVHGKETKLTVGEPATNPTQYSISAKIITCNSAVKKIRVYYMADEEVESVEIKEITPKNWSAVGILVAKEIESGKLYKCTLDMPNVSVSPNFGATFKNSDGAPDAVGLAINLMFDEGKGYVYSMNFSEEK